MAWASSDSPHPPKEEPGARCLLESPLSGLEGGREEQRANGAQEVAWKDEQ